MVTSHMSKRFSNMIVCLLSGFFCHPREFFTHSEWSPLPVKGYKMWPILDTRRHWAVRVFWRATPSVTRAIPLKWSSPRTRDTHTCCRVFCCFCCAVTTCVNYDLCLSRTGIKPRSSACQANALPLNHRQQTNMIFKKAGVAFRQEENLISGTQ